MMSTWSLMNFIFHFFYHTFRWAWYIHAAIPSCMHSNDSSLQCTCCTCKYQGCLLCKVWNDKGVHSRVMQITFIQTQRRQFSSSPWSRVESTIHHHHYWIIPGRVLTSRAFHSTRPFTHTMPHIHTLTNTYIRPNRSATWIFFDAQQRSIRDHHFFFLCSFKFWFEYVCLRNLPCASTKHTGKRGSGIKERMGSKWCDSAVHNGIFRVFF